MSGCTLIWSGAPGHEFGEATFTVGGVSSRFVLQSIGDAMSMQRLIEAAEAQGAARGQRALAQLVVGTLEPYRER